MHDLRAAALQRLDDVHAREQALLLRVEAVDLLDLLVELRDLVGQQLVAVVLVARSPSSSATCRAARRAPPWPARRRATRKNSWRLRLRSASRQGSRLILGMSVEAPQRQTARRQQRGRVLLHALRLGARRNLHLAERIAALGGDADPARDHVGDARNVGAAAADQDLLGLLAAGAGGEEELQRAAHLLAHVVDERVEHFGLVVGRQAAFFLGAAGFFHAEAVGAHDFFGQLLAAEGEIARVETFRSRSTVNVVLLAPKSTTAMLRSMPPSGIWCVSSRQAFSSANASTSTMRAVSPAACTAAWRCSTFSERVATSSTSSISGSFSDGPITSKSKLTSSIGNGMYWSACISTCASSSFSRRLRGIWMTLVIAASPLTATAHSLLRAPARFMARRTASPTAWASTMAFSLMAFGGVGSAAYDSTRYVSPLASARSA